MRFDSSQLKKLEDALEKLTAVAEEIEEPSPAGEESGESKEEVPCAQEESFGFSLEPNDVAIVGLGLCRLEEAAEEYLRTDGESEADTFPCVPTKSGLEANFERVINLLRRVSRLKSWFSELHGRMVNQEVRLEMWERLKDVREKLEKLKEASKQ